MIRDWDVWPWIIAANSGEISLATRRIEHAFLRLQSEIGLSLLPVMRSFQRVAAEFLGGQP